METTVQHISIACGTAAKLQGVEARILELTHMSSEELMNLKLEIGIRFVTEFCKMFISNRETVYNGLVYNADWCFWNWWQLQWGRDDAVLIQAGYSPTPGYTIKKEAMIGDDLMTKDLYWMIQKYTDEV